MWEKEMHTNRNNGELMTNMTRLTHSGIFLVTVRLDEKSIKI